MKDNDGKIRVTIRVHEEKAREIKKEAINEGVGISELLEKAFNEKYGYQHYEIIDRRKKENRNK